MIKKLLSLFLVICVLCSSVCVFAYSTDSAQILLKSMNIMSGDENGNMNLSDNVTRAEFAKIAVNSSKFKNSVALGAQISVFKDCTYQHWSAPYVKVAVTNGVLTGYPDGTFKPENNVLYEEAITVILKLLGYTNEDFGNSWPYGQTGLAENLSLNKNVSKGIGATLTREDVLILIYNMLTSNAKGSDKAYISQIEGSFYEDVVIMATNKEDTSVGGNSVLTSVGTFKLNDTFDYSHVGLKGDLAVKSSGEILAFMPYVQNSSKYVVYSTLSNAVVAYKDGQLTELDVSENTVVYSGTDKLTFSSARGKMNTGDVIYVVKDSKGSVEYLTLASDVMEGPYTLSAYSDTWFTMFTESASNLTVMRDGVKVSTTDLKTNDILYYSKDLNIVFAYSKKITGIYEKATPNKDTPETVTISGTEYAIESVSAFNKLSSNGELSFGDTVTLLFGKDGKIADVINGKTTTVDDTTVGYLVETGTKSFTDENNSSYTAKYVKLILPDGTEAQYIASREYTNYINSVMKVSFKNGIASLSTVGRSDVGGTVRAPAMLIGDDKVASNVKILDVSTVNKDILGNAVNTYMVRLDGISLSSTNVLWAKKNSDGEICELILKDVTGDTCEYGIVTSAADNSENPSYKIDVSGQNYSYNGGYHSNIKVSSPVKVYSSNGRVGSISSLKSINGNVSNVTENSITFKNTTYTLSDKVIIYKKNGFLNYTILAKSELKDGDKVSAFYDKEEKYGGRIRVIIVQD